jgi:protein ImuB
MFASIYAPGFSGSFIDFAYNFSPLVEEVVSDIVVVDIEGCDRLLGSPYSIANKIVKLAQETGNRVNVAIADNPDAAIHASRFLPGKTIIAPGKELSYLGNLPLQALKPVWAVNEPDRTVLEILETLELWGIRCFRDFSALPETGISERLGPQAVLLQKLASGSHYRELIIARPVPDFEKSFELDDPIELKEALSFILARLLNQLCNSLERRALAANEIHLRMKLESGALFERSMRLPFPTRDQRVLLKLIMLDIESHPPDSAVVSLSIKAEPTKPRISQKGMFQPLAPEPEKLEITMARIARLVGSNNIGSPVLLDTYRPTAFGLKPFGVLEHSNSKAKRRSQVQSSITRPRFKPLLGFRVFRPPLEVEVHAEAGRPARVTTSPDSRKDAKRRKINGRVLQRAGPWRTTGDWWSKTEWARDEWDVAISSSSEQGIYRIYRDLQSGSWFVDGVYD